MPHSLFVLILTNVRHGRVVNELELTVAKMKKTESNINMYSPCEVNLVVDVCEADHKRRYL